VELLEGVELLPRRGERDRLADDLFDAERSTATAVLTASWPVIASMTRNV
jgi:hypothetical protein